MRRFAWGALAGGALVSAGAVFWLTTRPPPRVVKPRDAGLFEDARLKNRTTSDGVEATLLTTGEAAQESTGGGLALRAVIGGAEGRRAIDEMLAAVERRALPVLERGPAEVRDAATRAAATLRGSLAAPGRRLPVRALVVSWSDGWVFARSVPGFDRYEAIAVFDHADPRFDAKRTLGSEDALHGTRLIVAHFVKADGAEGARRAAGAIEAHELGAPVDSAGPLGPEAEPVMRHVGMIRDHFPADGRVRSAGVVLTRDGTVVSHAPRLAPRRWTGDARFADDLRDLLAR